jgi:hypothetical protein
LREKESHELIRKRWRRSKVKQPLQRERRRADFFQAFAPGAILGPLPLIDATSNDLDHVSAVGCEMTAKSELSGQHHVLPIEVDRQNADHRARPQDLALEGDTGAAAIWQRY